MLSKVRWGKYNLEELYNVTTTTGIDEGSLELKENDSGKGDYVEFVGRTKLNNGIKGYTKRIQTISPQPKGTISISQVGTISAQIRKNEWYASQNIFQLTPKQSGLLSLFLLGVINRVLNETYSQGYSNYPTLEKLKKLVIELPVNNDGCIDFDFMDTFISELEAYHISELEAYLEVTGLKDYKLTKDELDAVERLERKSIKWKEIRIVDEFFVKNTSNILSEEIKENSGSTPYLGATSQNNGILSYISYDEQYKEEGNCIFIGGKTFVVTYQENDFYSNDSHNLVLYYNDKVQKNKFNNLFFCTSIKKSLGNKYSWGDSISKSKIHNDYMMMPVDDNDKVDYEFMKNLISGVEKLVIKDVVLYSDRKIKEAKKVIS